MINTYHTCENLLDANVTAVMAWDRWVEGEKACCLLIDAESKILSENESTQSLIADISVIKRLSLEG